MTIQVMNISVGTAEEICLVRISGVVDQAAAGPLYDTLFDIIGKGGTKLVIDVSGVDLLTRAAARSIVVAGKLLQSPHGAMRICGARAGVAAMLDGLGHANLVKRDPDLRASLEAISSGADAQTRQEPQTADSAFVPANTNVDAPLVQAAGQR